MRVPLTNIVPPQELDEQFIPPRSVHLVSTPPPTTYEITSPPRLHSMSREVSDSSQETNYSSPPSFIYNETPSRIGSFAESVEGISHLVNHPNFLADILRESEYENDASVHNLRQSSHSNGPSYHQQNYHAHRPQQSWARPDRRNCRNWGFVPIKHPQSWAPTINSNPPTQFPQEINVATTQETPTTPSRKSSSETNNSSPDKTRETPTKSDPSTPPSDQPLVPPRRPRSAYVLFFKSVRDNNLAQVRKRREKMMNMETLIPTVERLWKSMPEEERQSFQDQAKKEADEYEVAMELYKEQQKQAEKQSPEQGDESDNASKRPSTEQLPKASPRKKARCAPKEQGKDAGGHSSSASTTSTAVPASPFSTPPRQIWSAAAEQITRLQEGTEVYLNQGGTVRRYRIEYKCFLMEKSQLDDFLKSPSGTGGWPVSQPVWATPSSHCHDSPHLGNAERSHVG